MYLISLRIDEKLLQRYFARADETFFQFCDKELVKITIFFAGKKHYFIILIKLDNNGLYLNGTEVFSCFRFSFFSKDGFEI